MRSAVGRWRARVALGGGTLELRWRRRRRGGARRSRRAGAGGRQPDRQRDRARRRSEIVAEGRAQGRPTPDQRQRSRPSPRVRAGSAWARGARPVRRPWAPRPRPGGRSQGGGGARRPIRLRPGGRRLPRRPSSFRSPSRRPSPLPSGCREPQGAGGDLHRPGAARRGLPRPRSSPATARAWPVDTGRCGGWWWSPDAAAGGAADRRRRALGEARRTPGSGEIRAGRHPRGSGGRARPGAERARSRRLLPAVGAAAAAAARPGAPASPAAAGRSRSRSAAQGPWRLSAPRNAAAGGRRRHQRTAAARAPAGPTSPPRAVPLLAIGPGAEGPGPGVTSVATLGLTRRQALRLIAAESFARKLTLLPRG